MENIVKKEKYLQMFKQWKEQKDAVLREKAREKRHKERKELDKKQEDEYEKRKDNERAFKGWYGH